jgi:hypothetical protein
VLVGLIPIVVLVRGSARGLRGKEER